MRPVRKQADKNQLSRISLFSCRQFWLATGGDDTFNPIVTLMPAMRYNLSPCVTDHVLGSQLFGHLGCVANGQMMIWPVTYLFDGQAIYGQLLEDEQTPLLRTNPGVCFEVAELTSPFDWRSVMVQGIYEELQGEERSYVEQRLGPARVGAIPPQTTTDAASVAKPATIVYRIRILHKTGYRQLRQVQTASPTFATAW